MSAVEYELSRPKQLDKIEKKGTLVVVEATAEECTALANRFDLIEVKTLAATLKITPKNDGVTYHVSGQLTAELIQKSIVSGEGVPVNVETDIDGWYSDQSRIASFDRAKRNRNSESSDDEREIKQEKDDPESVFGGVLDMGEVAAQFLGLALDDYPRTNDEKEGAGDYIEIKPEDAKPNPFAKLAELKKD